MFVLSPLREFSFIFRCKVCSAAGGNIKKLEILPRLHFKGQKVLNDRMKLENNKTLRSVHFGVVVVELINCKCGGIVRRVRVRC